MKKTQVYTDIIDCAKPYFLASYPFQFKKRVVLCLSEQAEKWKREYKFWRIRMGKNQDRLSFVLQKDKSAFILMRILEGKRVILFADYKNFQKPLPALSELGKQLMKVKQGMEINFSLVLGWLLKAGYLRQKRVYQAGDFAVHGGIIDVFSINHQKPLRIEFWDNRVEKISFFSPQNESRLQSLEQVSLFPKRIQGAQGKILDYLNFKNTQIILDEPEEKIVEQVQGFEKIIFQSFSEPESNPTALKIKAPQSYQGRLNKFQADLEAYQEKGWKIFISSQRREEDVFTKFLVKERFKIGFMDYAEKVVLFTDIEIFGPRKKRTCQKRFKLDPFFISSLKPGDYVVHIDHGVALFSGMKKNILQKIEKEYFVLTYKEGDKLFLPVDQADRITRYVGSPHPQIHRLHGNLWQKIKCRAKQDTEKIARELLFLYAQRRAQKGYSFCGKPSLLPKIEKTFPYFETLDQTKVLQEIFKDMEQNKPMDRLLIGDVGFGKTEVALRAAVKAVEDRKQAALLAPTTILTEQHYQTFQQRLKGLPLKIGVINRFKSKAQQNLTLDKLNKGELDIIIGTHRLLSKDVRFFDLGLLIIDEEQKFGVRAKEKLKKMRTNVDVLTLSATPIPRTLNFSLSGIWDISTLRTPPASRRAVKTFILSYQEKIIQKAVKKELARGGQVYFLHNRVETIQVIAQKLKKLIPEARLDVAHAQLKEVDLFNVMQEFNQKKIDLLVCSSIIENGIDLPNVNTLIVDNAPLFGLGSLHQLRGRIGRSARQAYAYFLYQKKKLTEKARMRLQILKEMSGLGSGFEIALRDLELRGAGNILGREQSGHISSLGLHLYVQLLNQTIRKLKNSGLNEADLPLEVKIDLPLAVKIPKNYITQAGLRLKYYQRIARLESDPEIQEIQEELKDKFGPLPVQAIHLLQIISLRNFARQARINSIQTSTMQNLDGSSAKKITLSFVNEMNYDKIKKLLEYNPFWAVKEQSLKIDLNNLGKDWLEELKKSIKILA